MFVSWRTRQKGSKPGPRGPIGPLKEALLVHCTGPEDGSRQWETAEGTHLDLRGLDPPEPMVTILRMIDGGDAKTVLIAHFDREPIFLYPELDDRGWTHEMISSSCGGGGCGPDVTLRLVRLSP
jgi:hypothetical protein